MKTYREYRGNIKSGDLLAFSEAHGSFINRMLFRVIQFATRSRYHHVAIAVEAGDRLLVVEAVYPKVRIYPLSHKGPFLHIPMGLEWTAEDTTALLEPVGERYSLADAGLSVIKTPSDDTRWFCSELALRFYKRWGIDTGDGYTPGDLVAYLLRTYQGTYVDKVPANPNRLTWKNKEN